MTTNIVYDFIKDQIPPLEIRVWKNRMLTGLSLTIREREIAEEMMKGFSHKEIAAHLGITEKTVKNHANVIYKKCKVANRAEFFAKVMGLR